MAEPTRIIASNNNNPGSRIVPVLRRRVCDSPFLCCGRSIVVSSCKVNTHCLTPVANQKVITILINKRSTPDLAAASVLVFLGGNVFGRDSGVDVKLEPEVGFRQIDPPPPPDVHLHVSQSHIIDPRFPSFKLSPTPATNITDGSHRFTQTKSCVCPERHTSSNDATKSTMFVDREKRRGGGGAASRAFSSFLPSQCGVFCLSLATWNND